MRRQRETESCPGLNSGATTQGLALPLGAGTATLAKTATLGLPLSDWQIELDWCFLGKVNATRSFFEAIELANRRAAHLKIPEVMR